MAKREKEPRDSEQRKSVDQERSAHAADGQKTYFPVPSESPAGPVTSKLSKRRQLLREIAPAISPLIIGFALLLALIFVLGYWSLRRMDDVSQNVTESWRSYAAKSKLLLNLRLAVTKLDNEARARHNMEASGRLKPPFGFRVDVARDEVKDYFGQLDNPSLTDPLWVQFRNDLQEPFGATGKI